MRKVVSAFFIMLLTILCSNSLSLAYSESILFDTKFGDITGDGKEKIVELRVEDGTLQSGYIKIYIKDDFGNPLRVIPIQINSKPVKLFLGDFTGDGVKEIMTMTKLNSKDTFTTQIFSYENGEMILPSSEQSDSYVNQEFLPGYKVRVTSDEFNLNSIISLPKILKDISVLDLISEGGEFYPEGYRDAVDIDGDGVFELKENTSLKLDETRSVLGREIVYRWTGQTWKPVFLDIIPYHNIKVTLDGKHIPFDSEPEIVSGRTIVPVRNIFESMGASVDWNNKSRTVTIKRNTDVITLKVNGHATVNGRTVKLDVPTQIIDERTLVPIRFISESLGERVTWRGAGEGKGTVGIQTRR